MQQVVSRFNATLNDHDEDEQTQLYFAVGGADVESVRFLLNQEGILINKICREVIRSEGAADTIHWKTPMGKAETLVTLAATDGSLPDKVSRRRQVAELFRENNMASTNSWNAPSNSITYM